MAKRLFYALFYSLSFSLSAWCQQEGFSPHFWTGHIVHGSGGFVVDDNRKQGGIGIYLSKPSGSKVILRGNVGFFYGYEYGWQFANHGYLGGGLEWTILYPRNFLPTDEQKFSVTKKVLAWLQPLTHVRVGYVFNNHALLSLGLTLRARRIIL